MTATPSRRWLSFCNCGLSHEPRQIRRFYYDTAAIPNDVTLSALAKMVPASQILYGTDFPYGTAAYTTQGVTSFFKGADLAKVDRENALRLIPRLKTV